MKYINTTVIYGLLLASPLSFATSTSDSVTINQIFVKADGSFAVQATSPLTNASADRDCNNGQTWAQYWAGIDANASERIVAAILSAQAQNKVIKVQTDGCQGPWHKITSVYIP